MQEQINKHIILAWVAGLFEGEGCFNIQDKIMAKAVTITSTDLDVLEKVKLNFGGRIYSEKKRSNPKWKQAHNWTLTGPESLDFVVSIYGYLGKRRQARALEYTILHKEMKRKQDERHEKISKMKEEVFKLKEQGFTQGKIAKTLGYDRTYINKILNSKV